MKKLLVSAVAVAALAAPAMAQEFIPSEYQNSAMVEQIGTANKTIVNQRWGGLFNGQSLAEVMQEGRWNQADVAQRNAGGQIFRQFNNKATIDQVSESSRTIIRQIHDHAASVANEATVSQSAYNSRAFLYQRGDGNTGSIEQGPDGIVPWAFVGQNGLRNNAEVTQTSDGGSVTVNQGTYSSTFNPYSADSSDNDVVITSAGANPLITVTQMGQGNWAVIDEDGVDGTINVNSSTFLNGAYVNQYSTGGSAMIDQVGAGHNTGTIWQASDDLGSSALINQTGVGGSSMIEQRDTDGLGGGNTATSSQSGTNWGSDLITSSILQDGVGNVATVDQSSAVAASTVEQVGTTHIANVSQ